MDGLDYSDLDEADIEWVEKAFAARDGENIASYIPDKKFKFVLRNYKRLAELEILVRNWMTAYLHESHLNDVPLSTLQDVFNTCDKAVLQQYYPIPAIPRLSGERFSLFRGCAGPDHRMGMSWLTSIDKAIWYATHHAELYGLNNLAVYVAAVDREEIYCCGGHYDYDYIVCPKAWWRVNVPSEEFRLDRPR
jgi:hypothetical protein